MPAVNQFCEYDAFVASDPYNGKVFLQPWESSERLGDWYEARGYCAKHCAELVTIHSATENAFFFDFMRQVNFYTWVWMGAEIESLAAFTTWSNGEPNDYSAMAPGEPNEPGHTCLNGGPNIYNYWYNDYCYDTNALIACQRPANWTTCGAAPAATDLE